MEKLEYVEVPGSPPAEPIVLGGPTTRVYRRRWVILALFSAFCMTTTFQWVQYTIVGDLVARHYGISSAQVDWTSLVYMASLPVLMIPSCFLLDRMGMRWCMEMGAIMMAVGSCIKVVAVRPDRFKLALFGQSLVGASQVFILGSPPRVAATWFAASQLSTACAIGVFGNQLGAAMGFLLTPLMVRSHEDPADIGRDLKQMLLITAGVSMLVLVLIILLFKERPDLPPSPMQALERSAATHVTLKEFLRSVGDLMTNRNFLLMLISNGISGGVLNVVGTVLNPVILLHFPNEQQFAGRVGLVIILSGMLGCILFGVLLDRTHRYKDISLGVYVLLVLANAGFAVVFWAKNAHLVYISAGIFGLFLFGYVTVSFEMSAEVTYPASESTMGGLLLIPANVLGFAMTVVFTRVLEHWGDFHANMLMTASLVVGAILTACIQKDYRRLAANTIPVKA